MNKTTGSSVGEPKKTPAPGGPVRKKPQSQAQTATAKPNTGLLKLSIATLLVVLVGCVVVIVFVLQELKQQKLVAEKNATSLQEQVDFEARYDRLAAQYKQSNQMQKALQARLEATQTQLQAAQDKVSAAEVATTANSAEDSSNAVPQEQSEETQTLPSTANQVAISHKVVQAKPGLASVMPMLVMAQYLPNQEAAGLLAKARKLQAVQQHPELAAVMTADITQLKKAAAITVDWQGIYQHLSTLEMLLPKLQEIDQKQQEKVVAAPTDGNKADSSEPHGELKALWGQIKHEFNQLVVVRKIDRSEASRMITEKRFATLAKVRAALNLLNQASYQKALQQLLAQTPTGDDVSIERFKTAINWLQQQSIQPQQVALQSLTVAEALQKQSVTEGNQ